MKKRNLIVSEPNVPITTEMLRAVRDQAIEQHFSISKTIADLEELSNEIEATLAYLKARRGDR